MRRAKGYGGFNALSDFAQGAGIGATLTEAFSGEKAPWGIFLLPETLRHLLDGYRLGVERVWHFADLEQEPLLCAKRDRERLPDYTLLYRDLTRFEAPAMLERLRTVGEWRVREALAVQAWYTLDCDSTVETVYDEQEGARRGLNPHKGAAPSERRSGLVVNSRLRPGDAGTVTDAVAFIRQSVARLPRVRHRNVPIRADRGFDADGL